MKKLGARQTNFRLVAEAESLDELEQLTPDLELEHDQKVRTEIELSVPIAQAIDLAGVNFLARQFWQQALAPEGVHVDRVFALDSHTLVMEGTVTGTPLLGIVRAVIFLLGAIALLIVAIRLLIEIFPGLGPLLTQFLPIALLIGGGLFLFLPSGGDR